MSDDDEIFALLGQSVESAEQTRWSRSALTPGQDGWLKQTDPVAIWRGGNQLGSPGDSRLTSSCSPRKHPYDQTHKPPVRIVVASESWAQMDPLARKLWELLPKDDIDPKLYYSPGQGIKGYKEAVIPFVSGPGAGSLITLCTYKQGATRLAGGTYHRGYCDEPPPEAFFGELRPRLNVLDGHLRMTFTPTPESPPLEYLREKVELWKKHQPGGIVEHHTILSEAVCWPKGALLPFMTQSKVDRFIADCIPAERLMRAEGAWDPIVKGRWLDNYSDDRCARDFVIGGTRSIDVPPGAKLLVGMDHGAAAGKQASALIAVTQEQGLTPRIWVIDAEQADDMTTPEEDARRLLAMLNRHGLTYDHVDEWVGDRSAQGSHRSPIKKSNADVRRYLAAALGRNAGDLKYIHTPKKSGGSVWRGARIMNAALGRDTAQGHAHLLVHTRAKLAIDSFKGFKGDPKDPCKDVFDAVRYPIERAVDARTGWLSTTGQIARYT